jgi:hypothetical protein
VNDYKLADILRELSQIRRETEAMRRSVDSMKSSCDSASTAIWVLITVANVALLLACVK